MCLTQMFLKIVVTYQSSEFSYQCVHAICVRLIHIFITTTELCLLLVIYDLALVTNYNVSKHYKVISNKTILLGL